MDYYGLSTLRACRLVKQACSTRYGRIVEDPKTELRQRMREIERTRVRYGCRRVRVLRKREGWRVSRNRVYRPYTDEAAPEVAQRRQIFCNVGQRIHWRRHKGYI